MPKEYSGSKYTNSIKGMNAKAKANAAQGIPELIEIAVEKTFERITKKNIGEMQNSAGIDIIHDLHCRYMMKWGR